MEPDVEMHERMARIEVKLSSHISDEEEQMRSVDRKLDRIELELSRYRGFVGGILLMVTAIVTFLKIFGSGIVEFFSK